MKPTRLKIVYILSSTYDDEGDVIRYWRGILPSNTLCVMKSLTEAIAESGEIGEGIEVSVDVYDDTVQRIPVGRIARMNRRPDTQLVVGFVGVQTNQFARAADLALEFRDHGVPVLMGGFHVSGMLALFNEPSPEIQCLIDRGVTVVKGEAEASGALAGILRDAVNGTLEPIYDFAEAPDLTAAPLPRPDHEYLRHFKAREMATLDTSRGCPFNCSFCTIINVQGRRMRSRSAECMLQAIERNYDEGISFYFFTDDNLARSPVRDELLDGIIEFRERGLDIHFMMQVDVRAHAIPGFTEKAARAGCYMAFIGMESVNPDNIEATGKVQNDAEDYPDMVEAWRREKVLVHVGYIIGMPHDTCESVRRDIDALMNTVKVDEATFFMMTPLPGSKDHQQMVEDHVPMDADLNTFDSLHETFRHQRMAPGEWLASFKEAWHSFYSKENMINVMFRTCRERYWLMLWTFMWYRYSILHGTHPMFTGLIRLKDRIHRRSLFPREGRLRYGWRRIKELSNEVRVLGRLFFEFQEIWLLTRKPNDPRWAALADLRTKWTEVEHRLHECDVRGRCDEGAQALREMLQAASEQLRRASQSAHGRLRRKLRRKAGEVESYLRTFDSAHQTWHQLVQTERYVRDQVLGGYEEVAIRYVASRRRFNAYRRDVVDRLKTGRILTLNVSTLPRAVVFELALGARFGFWFLSGGGA